MTAPSIRIERVVEWPDTDAAGHYHHSSVIRWVEAAESELHLALGLPELFGHVPRVHYEVDYVERLWFRDTVAIELRVAEVGGASLTYDFEVCRGETPAARGRLVCVRSDPGGRGAQAWPDEVAAILRGEAPPRPSAGAEKPAPPVSGRRKARPRQRGMNRPPLTSSTTPVM